MTTTATRTHLQASRVALPQEQRETLVASLNQILAETIDLHGQTKQAHWNVRGPNFMQMHEMYDRIAAMVQPHVDSIAERVTALGGAAEGAAAHVVHRSRLDAWPEGMSDESTLLDAVTARYDTYAAHLRDAIAEASDLGDPATEDLFTGVLRDAETALYFLAAHAPADEGAR
jgi:starvation-inducible DNA-binding protein